MLELWQTLLSKWRLEEKVHQGITYRLVSKSYNQYELSKIIIGPCGEKNYHPRIMIEEVDGRPVEQSLIDYEVTPILNLKREKDEEQINQAFVQLMEEFIAIA